ncbi:alkaline phosphatase family protein [Metabacillus sp. RGM 3146]|uniref:alkaline phosphatase family protein n=1 Tax=Metabacillus sp. RGM 3146 TaxID=3401092 RepID=UPI003B9B70F7
MLKKWVLLLLCTLFTLSACSNPAPKKQGLNSAPKNVSYKVNRTPHQAVKRVLLISVDGLHESDLASYVKKHPHSSLSALSNHGITYTNASATRPSDSFPGLSAMITGGSPNATGVVYDDSYDRKLLPPLAKKAGDKPGTEVLYDETIDKDLNKINGGGGINPAMLPRDPVTKQPVYPHNYLRVNTIFEVVKAAGKHTAWADKHLAYDLVKGPSGKGVNDLYTPEIVANGDASKSIFATEKNDDLKVTAIQNEIRGRDHTGLKPANVPALFGMNFQAVSVAQKLPGNGYADSKDKFSKGLAHAMNHTDQSIGKIVNELKKNNLYHSTLIIVSAKHGQSPMDPAKLRITDEKLITQGVSGSLVAQLTADDVAYIWLTDQSKTVSVVNAIKKNKGKANIQDVYSYQTSRSNWFFNNPADDSRIPDIVVKPKYGVIYTKPGKKIAEHGGINKDDTHVAMLVSFAGMKKSKQITSSVYTAEIAPTILRVLGLNPRSLKAVRMETTPVLPGIGQ